MGINYFNPQSSGSNTLGAVYVPKTITALNQLAPLGWPVWRSGASDKYFRSTSTWVNDTGIELHSYTATTDTLIASIGYQTATSSPSSTAGVAYHMNSTDQCLYVLVQYNAGTSHWRLIKISDTTGAVTTIGSDFTPTSPQNWPVFGSFQQGCMALDTASGHIKITYNGVYHLLNKSTGAIVTQDAPIPAIGAYYTSGVNYITADGSIGAKGGFVPDGTNTTITTPSLISSSFGVLKPTVFTHTLCRLPWTSSTFHTIDSDKLVAYSTTDGATGTGQKLATILYRSEWDKVLKSTHDIITAV